MSTTLTGEEAARFEDIANDYSPGEQTYPALTEDMDFLVAIIRRLDSELTALRARNAELEAVVKRSPPPLDVYMLPIAIHDMIRDLQNENYNLSARFEAQGRELALEKATSKLRLQDNRDCQRELDALRAELEKVKEREASVYELLKAHDHYGTGGDASVCAREVLTVLREKETALKEARTTGERLEKALAEVRAGTVHICDDYDEVIKKRDAEIDGLKARVEQLEGAGKRLSTSLGIKHWGYDGYECYSQEHADFDAVLYPAALHPPSPAPERGPCICPLAEGPHYWDCPLRAAPSRKEGGE